MRGYFEIGVYRPKTADNIGTLMRSAFQLGAAGVFVVGARYRRQGSDTPKAWRHIPLREFADFTAFRDALPLDSELIGIEMGGKPLAQFTHPIRGVYLLGAEDTGLPEDILAACHRRVSLEASVTPSFNVSVAGSIVIYDRLFGRNTRFTQ